MVKVLRFYTYTSVMLGVFGALGKLNGKQYLLPPTQGPLLDMLLSLPLTWRDAIDPKHLLIRYFREEAGFDLSSLSTHPAPAMLKRIRTYCLRNPIAESSYRSTICDGEFVLLDILPPGPLRKYLAQVHRRVVSRQAVGCQLLSRFSAAEVFARGLLYGRVTDISARTLHTLGDESQ
jgi:hypothetical protein